MTFLFVANKITYIFDLILSFMSSILKSIKFRTIESIKFLFKPITVFIYFKKIIISLSISTKNRQIMFKVTQFV